MTGPGPSPFRAHDGLKSRRQADPEHGVEIEVEVDEDVEESPTEPTPTVESVITIEDLPQAQQEHDPDTGGPETFHDLVKETMARVQEGPIGQLHRHYMPQGVLTIKLLLIGMVLLKFTGWVQLSWFWVLWPIWAPLALSLVVPFIIFVGLLIKRRLERPTS